MLPNSAPQASEVLQHAIKAVAVDDGGILYARSKVQWGPTGGAPDAGRRSRQVWVQGDTAMRWLEDGGDEEVFRKGEGTTRRTPDGKLRTEPTCGWCRTRSSAPAAAARGAAGSRSTRGDRRRLRPALEEKSGPPHWPTIEMTMWIDKETYEPLRFTDHSFGKDVEGKPFDQTYTEDIVEFKTLPDTPENRRAA